MDNKKTCFHLPTTLDKNNNTPEFVKQLTKKVVQMISDEVASVESQLLIKQNIITPVINMIYVELYPYIVVMICTIIVILVLSFLTFMCFIFFLIRR